MSCILYNSNLICNKDCAECNILFKSVFKDAIYRHIDKDTGRVEICCPECHRMLVSDLTDKYTISEINQGICANCERGVKND